jgi:3-oxoacyl-[acyl-carrier protein] reductase
MTDLHAAIVTGASSGIGAAVALRLAARGAGVIVNCARNVDAAEEVAAACRRAGGRARVVQGDVADDSACRELVATAIAEYGRLDYLVNNAGMSTFVAHGNLDGLDAVDFARIFAVNVTGAFQMIRASMPALREGGQGAIVNVASIAGTCAIGSSVAYAASKAALINMTTSLARALAPSVRINAVAPGFVDTPWHARGMDAARLERVVAAVKDGTPMKAVTGPDDVAEPILWLLEHARHVTGETLHVDAGLHLRMGQFA